MTKKQNDQLEMLLLVKSFFNENEAAISAQIPAFAGLKTTYEGLVSGILESAAEAGYDRTGVAQDKKDARIKLRQSMQRIGIGAELYYTHQLPDAALAARMNLCKKTAVNQSASDLIVNSYSVHEVADGIKTLLAPYGINASQVDELLMLIAAFENLRAAPQESRLEGVRYRLLTRARLKESVNLLSAVIDPMMDLLQYSSGLLYKKYRSSRKLRASGGGRQSSKPYTTRLNPGASKAMNLPAKPIDSATVVRLSSHSKAAEGNVRIYFAADATQPPAGGISLEALEQNVLSAQSLGYTSLKTCLCAYNSGHKPHTIGVLIIEEK